jgi:hypothetical protein
MIATRNKTSEKVISNSKISVPSKIKKDKSVVVKKRKVNVAFEETDADNSFDSLYSKIYDKVMADVAKEMNDREKLLASNFEAQIQKAAMNNRHLLDQRWTLLPELVNQATSRIINAKNEKDKIFKNCLDQELENRPNQSSLYSKDDFFSCFNEITSTVVFREVFLKHKSKLDNIRYIYILYIYSNFTFTRDRFKGFKKSDILLLNIDSSKEDEEFSRNLNCYQSSFKICRDRRLPTEDITDESEESVAETKSEPSSNDNRKIVSLVGETESEKVIRVLESDKIRATLLSLINCITSHKLMSKFFYEGNGTIFGISLIDLPAPDAFDFMITQIADYIFLYVGIPEIITVQIQDPTTVETRILNLSSKLGARLL